MPSLENNRLILVLVALLAITLISWVLSNYVKIQPETLGALILAFAFIKVRLIVIHYMEAARAAGMVRIAFEAWIWLVAAVIIALYLL